MKIPIPLFACLAMLSVAGARADDKTLSRRITFKGADAVVVAKFDRVTPVGILYTLPPVYTSEVRLTVEDVVRGPLRKGLAVEVHYNLTQMDRPVYPVGQTCLIALERNRQGNAWTVLLLEVANEENVKEAKLAR